MYENVSVEFNSFDRDDLMTTRTLLRVARDILDHDPEGRLSTYIAILKPIIMESKNEVSKIICKIDDAINKEELK